MKCNTLSFNVGRYPCCFPGASAPGELAAAHIAQLICVYLSTYCLIPPNSGQDVIVVVVATVAKQWQMGRNGYLHLSMGNYVATYVVMMMTMVMATRWRRWWWRWWFDRRTGTFIEWWLIRASASVMRIMDRPSQSQNWRAAACCCQLEVAQFYDLGKPSGSARLCTEKNIRKNARNNINFTNVM